MTEPGKVRTRMLNVGTQGWNYDAWVGPFFPPRTKSDEFLGQYSKIFDTVEIDATFYAPPTATSIASWLKKTPEGFSFSLKLPRRITHESRLRDCSDDLSVFCERARLFGGRLASILIQLPPDFGPSEFGVLDRFLAKLPDDIRFAIEFRDAGWLTERTHRLLASHRVALALVESEWLPREQVLAYSEKPTAAFTYLRWLGSRSITDHSRVQLARDDEFDQWAKGCAKICANVDLTLAYFSNFFQGHAPASAIRFQRLMGQDPRDPSSLIVQPSLFG